MKRIGIMGGTFNPIHYGHLISAEAVRDKLQLDFVLFIPSGNPPHKKNIELMEASDRYKTIKLAISGVEGFVLSDMELKRAGKTYTVDTLKELHKTYYGNQFFFIIGFDTLKELSSWKSIDQLGSLCEFAVVNRSNSTEELRAEFTEKSGKFNLRLHSVPIPEVNISSTMIRNRLKRGLSIRGLTPDAVVDYIENHQYYR